MHNRVLIIILYLLILVKVLIKLDLVAFTIDLVQMSYIELYLYACEILTIWSLFIINFFYYFIIKDFLLSSLKDNKGNKTVNLHTFYLS